MTYTKSTHTHTVPGAAAGGAVTGAGAFETAGGAVAAAGG